MLNSSFSSVKFSFKFNLMESASHFKETHLWDTTTKGEGQRWMCFTILSKSQVQDQRVRGQHDWPAPTSIAGSPWWHPPLHLWEGWRDDRERRGMKGEERWICKDSKRGGQENYKEILRMSGGHINKVQGEVREKTVRKQRTGTEWGRRSERGVVGKSSMKRKKTQLDKQKNISRRREKKGKTDSE